MDKVLDSCCLKIVHTCRRSGNNEHRTAVKILKRRHGILSVLLQTFYRIEYLFTVNEKVFDPPPKVKSAVIRLVRNGRTDLPCDEKLFFDIVKAGFNQRRKTLRNSIRELLPPQFESPYLNLRPEQLSVDDFLILATAIQQKERDIHNT